MLNAQCSMPKSETAALCQDMRSLIPTTGPKPFDLQDRLLVFACDVVRTVQFLHSRGPVARALSYQILDAGTAVGSNAEEADGAAVEEGTRRRDFIAKIVHNATRNALANKLRSALTVVLGIEH